MVEAALSPAATPAFLFFFGAIEILNYVRPRSTFRLVRTLALSCSHDVRASALFLRALVRRCRRHVVWCGRARACAGRSSSVPLRTAKLNSPFSVVRPSSSSCRSFRIRFHNLNRVTYDNCHDHVRNRALTCRTTITVYPVTGRGSAPCRSRTY